ncbi:CHASE2 domain protein [compost metagenome]
MFRVLDDGFEKLRKWPLARIGLYLMLGYWGLFCDPFGLSSAADKALSDQLGRFRAFSHPVAPAPVTVVAIDYPSIAGLHNDGKGWLEANDWPLTYADHGRILRDLALPKSGEPAPAAIFYDIFFERPRTTSGDLQQLGRVLERLDANPVASRIHLAGGGSFVPMSPQAREQLQSASLAVSAWDGVGDLYPLKAPLGTATTAEPVATAAGALYQDLCKARAEDCRWAEAASLPELSIQWAMTSRDDCRAEHASALRDVISILWRLAGLSTAAENPTAACMPVHQVRLSQLYGEHPVSLRPPRLKPGEPFVVLVGNVMPSLNDYVQSPLYGQVAGVYLHANALANLDERGEHYIHQSDSQIANFLFLLVMILMCMHLQGTLGWQVQTRKSSAAEKDSFVFKIMKTLGFTALNTLVVAVGYYLFYLANMAPDGWLALAAFMPFLWEVVLAGEQNYSKDGPDEKAFLNPAVATC